MEPISKYLVRQMYVIKAYTCLLNIFLISNYILLQLIIYIQKTRIREKMYVPASCLIFHYLSFMNDQTSGFINNRSGNCALI